VNAAKGKGKRGRKEKNAQEKEGRKKERKQTYGLASLDKANCTKYPAFTPLWKSLTGKVQVGNCAKFEK
jgi:hypothetical protein